MESRKGALGARHTHMGAEADKAAEDSSEDKRPDSRNWAERNPRPNWG